MKVIVRAFLLMVAISSLTQLAHAQREFGVGIILGEPSGISVKQWISRTAAIDGGFAWSFTNDTKIQVHSDYLKHRVYLFESDDFDSRIPVYYGLGARVILGDDPTIGVRFPVGVGKTFSEHPIELFLEIVPILDIAPSSDFDLNAAIGARYYLNR